MPGIIINHEKCTLCGECVKACPFIAMEEIKGKIEINAACKLCKICVKKCPENAIEFVDKPVQTVNKSAWRDILVFAETENGAVHPVAFELIGKAQELVENIGQRVHALLIGNGAKSCAESLKGYDLGQILVYDRPEYRHFMADVYAKAFADAINRLKPSAILVGATALGRSLAPRLSTRFRTGLTADCTALEMRENGDLVQIRPAFGGDIMARIITPNTRPQFATVRYKTMDKAAKANTDSGEIVYCDLPPQEPRMTVLKAERKPAEVNISDAEILVAGGRGLKSPDDLKLLEKLAEKLGGQLAGTRPLIEAGWLPYTRQIGLSGRTVKPRLIITAGISGAVQFTAAMREAECIIAINSNENAPIFKVAHVCVVGDLYEVLPMLAQKLKGEKRP
jgi:electron transfer flavoprotein alpha subunit